MNNIQGTLGIDFLNGTIEPDLITALASNDSVLGNDGNDLIYGDAGDDFLLGQKNADTIYGGDHNDSIFGGKGADFLMGNLGNDWLTGGAGNDLFVLARQTDMDIITDFGQGRDRLVLLGGLKSDDLMISYDQNNTLIKDKNTGADIAILTGLVNLNQSDFISLFLAEDLGQVLPISATVNISEQTLELEVAQTPLEQAIGLMYRTELGDRQGMLFPMDPPRQVAFWMRNTLINLDMIFLRNGIIQDIIPNVPPCVSETCPTYGPNAIIDSVLELRGGQAATLNLQIGDRLDIIKV